MPETAAPTFCEDTCDAFDINGRVTSRYPWSLINFIPSIMQNKPVLELSDVKIIVQAAEACAIQNHWAVTIAVVDDGGHLLWLQRLDGAAAVSSTSHLPKRTQPRWVGVKARFMKMLSMAGEPHF